MHVFLVYNCLPYNYVNELARDMCLKSSNNELMKDNVQVKCANAHGCVFVWDLHAKIDKTLYTYH